MALAATLDLDSPRSTATVVGWLVLAVVGVVWGGNCFVGRIYRVKPWVSPAVRNAISSFSHHRVNRRSGLLTGATGLR